MTTRRTFLKAFLGVAASLALAQRVVLDVLKVEAEPPLVLHGEGINPAWHEAPYEVCVIYHPGFAPKDAEPSEFGDEGRFALVDGEFIPVPKYLA